MNHVDIKSESIYEQAEDMFKKFNDLYVDIDTDKEDKNEFFDTNGQNLGKNSRIVFKAQKICVKYLVSVILRFGEVGIKGKDFEKVSKTRNLHLLMHYCNTNNIHIPDELQIALGGLDAYYFMAFEPEYGSYPASANEAENVRSTIEKTHDWVDSIDVNEDKYVKADEDEYADDEDDHDFDCEEDEGSNNTYLIDADYNETDDDWIFKINISDKDKNSLEDVCKKAGFDLAEFVDIFFDWIRKKPDKATEWIQNEL